MYPDTGTPGAHATPSVGALLLDSELPVDAGPDPADPRWIRVDTLLDPARWRGLGAAYSRRIGTPHLAPGLVCALQHYTGRVLQPIVVAWCADGTLLDPAHRRWWVRVDREAATERVALPGLPTLGSDDRATGLVEVIREHLLPLVDAVTAAGPATRRVALGCVAASLAGSFGLAHRGSEPADRPRIRAAVRAALAGLDAGGRPTASAVHLTAPDSLVHDRHTCCLIRLGREHRTCASCPRLDESERRHRQREAARGASVPVVLPARGAVRTRAGSA